MYKSVNQLLTEIEEAKVILNVNPWIEYILEHLNDSPLEDDVKNEIRYIVSKLAQDYIESGEMNIPPEMKNKLDTISVGAEVNQNAFSRIKIGNSLIEAIKTTDDIKIIPHNNIKITIDDETREIHIDIDHTDIESAIKNLSDKTSEDINTFKTDVENTLSGKINDIDNAIDNINTTIDQKFLDVLEDIPLKDENGKVSKEDLPTITPDDTMSVPRYRKTCVCESSGWYRVLRFKPTNNFSFLININRNWNNTPPEMYTLFVYGNILDRDGDKFAIGFNQINAHVSSDQRITAMRLVWDSDGNDPSNHYMYIDIQYTYSLSNLVYITIDNASGSSSTSIPMEVLGLESEIINPQLSENNFPHVWNFDKRGGMIAEYAEKDITGKNIPETYATKEEVSGISVETIHGIPSYTKPIDLRDTSVYNEDMYYPVYADLSANIPFVYFEAYTGLGLSGNPSYSNHVNGFTARLALLSRVSGWGSQYASTIILDRQAYCGYNGNNYPIGWSQIREYSVIIFWLRGGAKYNIMSTIDIDWQIATNTVSFGSGSHIKQISPSADYIYNYEAGGIYSNLYGSVLNPETDEHRYVTKEEGDQLKKSVSDGKTLVANAITAKGITTATDATFAILADNISRIVAMGGGIIDTSDATAIAAQILEECIAYVKGVKVVGTMPNCGKVTPGALAAGRSYMIPMGYHNGQGIVTTKSLAEQTSANADANHMLSGYSAWVNGSKITGNIPVAPTHPNENSGIDLHFYGNETSGRGHNIFIMVPQGYYNRTWVGYKDVNLIPENLKKGVVIGGGRVITGTYTSDGTILATDVLSGKIGYSNGNRIVGNMPNQGAKSATLNCGGSYTIPKGYHNGSGVIRAATLASQTSATAVAGDLLSGKTMWVGGVKLTGTLSVYHKRIPYTTITGSATINLFSYIETNVTQFVVVLCRSKQNLKSGSPQIYYDLSLISTRPGTGNFITTSADLAFMNNCRTALGSGTMLKTFDSNWSSRANSIQSALFALPANMCMPAQPNQLSAMQVGQRFTDGGGYSVASCQYIVDIWYWVDR